MKIRKVKFPEALTTPGGLKEIDLNRLGNVVALIGKNGSGKTRLLNFIENKIDSIFTIENILRNEVTHLPLSLQKLISELMPYRDYILLKEELKRINLERRRLPDKHHLETEYQRLSSEFTQLEINLNATINIANGLLKSENIIREMVNKNDPKKNNLLPDTSQTIKNIIESSSMKLSLLKERYVKRVHYKDIQQLQGALDKDDKTVAFEELIDTVSDDLIYDEFGAIYKTGLRYLRKLPHELSFEWIDCLGNVEKFHKTVAYKRYKAFKDIFDKIFGKEIEWETLKINKNVTEAGVQSTLAGRWKINGREFNYSEFSDGEKTLFAYVLLFFLMAQNDNIRLKESIIIIDEPELHLHADAEIDLINGIRNIVEEKGQLWIATHSINILSNLNYEEVFVVKDGQIMHPSRTTQKEALSQLLKIDERVHKLSEFISSISDWSYVQFVSECFLNPDVIEIAHANDPQIKTFKEILFGEHSDMLTILDFGAGKGRLFEQLSGDKRFDKNLQYHTLEPNKEFHKHLESLRVHKIITSYNQLQDETYDCIILCNVLHEIKITEWVKTLRKIIAALKPAGHLLIIEPRILNKGEYISGAGYIVFNERQIMELFQLMRKPQSLTNDNFENIMALLIQKPDILKLDYSTLGVALKNLEKSSFEEIKKIKTETDLDAINNSKLGRKLAFLSQLYFNSKIAQAAIGDELTELVNEH